MHAIGPSISSDRPNMPQATILGIMDMVTIPSGTTIETAIATRTAELYSAHLTQDLNVALLAREGHAPTSAAGGAIIKRDLYSGLS
jgi:hypothetical protein